MRQGTRVISSFAPCAQVSWEIISKEKVSASGTAVDSSPTWRCIASTVYALCAFTCCRASSKIACAIVSSCILNDKITTERYTIKNFFVFVPSLIK